MNEISVFIRRDKRNILLLFLCLLSSEEQVDDCEANQEESSHQIQTCRTLTLDCSASEREIRFVVSAAQSIVFLL